MQVLCSLVKYRASLIGGVLCVLSVSLIALIALKAFVSSKPKGCRMGSSITASLLKIAQEYASSS
jgi:hypothetical protein